MNFNKLSEDPKQEILEYAKRLYNDGWSVKGVAARFRLSRFTAWKIKKIVENM